MQMNTTSVDAYLQDGCGRCEHYKTPQCKVHNWHVSGAKQSKTRAARAERCAAKILTGKGFNER